MRNHSSSPARRGSVLVEFAVIALVLYFLLAATFEFGRVMYSAQAIQQAADAGARELAKSPLPAGITFDDALYRDYAAQPPGAQAAIQSARARVYSQDFLVIDLTTTDPQTAFSAAPLVNQMLRPLMIVDDQRADGGGWYLRYPGALVPVPPGETPTPTGLTVRIPLVSIGADGTETISPEAEWLRPVEEVRPAVATEGPFSLTAPDPNPPELRGMVALRVNYPYQAAALVAYPPQPDTFPPEPNILNEIAVPDDDRGPAGTYAGQNGLGRHYAVGKQVRPFRKVLTGQAFARREIFQ